MLNHASLRRARQMFWPIGLATIILLSTLACGDDATQTPQPTATTTTPSTPAPSPTQGPAPTQTPTPTQTPSPTSAENTTASPSPSPGETVSPTATGTDTASQFPPDVQPLLAELQPNLVQLLAEVRAEGPGELVWLTPGGEFHEASKRAFLDNWEKITGWTVIEAPATGDYLGVLETQVNAGSPDWDVANIGEYGIAERMAADNLFEKLDTSLFPLDAIPDNVRMTEDYAEIAPYFTVVVWNTEIFPADGRHPDSVLDVFNTDEFPGKRCIWDGAEYGWNLEYALMADGVPFDQVYQLLATEEGRDRAFAKLDTIRDDLVFWGSGAESLQFVLDGQCDLGTTWANRVATRLKEEPELPLAMSWNDAIGGGDPWIVPRGAPSAEAAQSALAYAVSPASQCRLLNESGQGIVMDAPPFPDCLTEFARQWGPQNDLLAGSEDADFWREYSDEYSEEWAAWKTEG